MPYIYWAAPFDMIEVVHSLLPRLVSVGIFRANPIFGALVRTTVIQWGNPPQPRKWNAIKLVIYEKVGWDGRIFF